MIIFGIGEVMITVRPESIPQFLMFRLTHRAG